MFITKPKKIQNKQDEIEKKYVDQKGQWEKMFKNKKNKDEIEKKYEKQDKKLGKSNTAPKNYKITKKANSITAQ